jgi:hypothetical protein
MKNYKAALIDFQSAIKQGRLELSEDDLEVLQKEKAATEAEIWKPQGRYSDRSEPTLRVSLFPSSCEVIAWLTLDFSVDDGFVGLR